MEIPGRCELAGNGKLGRYQQFQALPWIENTPWDFRYSGNFNTIMWIAITIAGSESEELTINQSGNAIDLASTVNLRNTLGL